MSKVNVRSMSVAAMLAVLTATAYADNGHDHGAPGKSQASGHSAGHTHPSESLATGTVRALDAKSGQVTIAHGPLANLGMGAMTTPFKVRDPAMLKSIKVGQSVRFAAQQADGTYTLTRVEAMPR